MMKTTIPTRTESTPLLKDASNQSHKTGTATAGKLFTADSRRGLPDSFEATLTGPMFSFLPQKEKETLARSSKRLNLACKEHARLQLKTQIKHADSLISALDRSDIDYASLRINLIKLAKMKQTTYAPCRALKNPHEFSTNPLDLLCLIALSGSHNAFINFIKDRKIETKNFSLSEWKALLNYAALSGKVTMLKEIATFIDKLPPDIQKKLFENTLFERRRKRKELIIRYLTKGMKFFLPLLAISTAFAVLAGIGILPISLFLPALVIAVFVAYIPSAALVGYYFSDKQHRFPTNLSYKILNSEFDSATLCCAAISGSIDCIKFANKYSLSESHGNEVFCFAALSGKQEVLEWLFKPKNRTYALQVRNQALLALPDAAGYTIGDYAMASGNPEIIKPKFLSRLGIPLPTKAMSLRSPANLALPQSTSSRIATDNASQVSNAAASPAPRRP